MGIEGVDLYVTNVHPEMFWRQLNFADFDIFEVAHGDRLPDRRADHSAQS